MELTLIFYAIQIAKSFYDHGRFDVFKKAFPQHILREDSFYELQELALDIVSEFHCFNQKLDYEYDISSYYTGPLAEDTIRFLPAFCISGVITRQNPMQ